MDINLGDVTIHQNEDGSYTCTCGETLPGQIALSRHRFARANSMRQGHYEWLANQKEEDQ